MYIMLMNFVGQDDVAQTFPPLRMKKCLLHMMSILNHATQSILMMELYHFHVNFIGSCCKELFDKHLLKDIDEILLKTKQSKEFWNIERKFRVTGSRIYELYTYKSDDWQKKANRYFNPISFMNKFTKHGIEQKPVARQIFMDATGLKVVECGLVVSHFNSWLGYSPDGIIVDQDGNPKELIEIKCPFAGATETIGSVVPKLKYLQLEDNIYELKKKHKYFAQVQLGMAMLNVFNCKFIIYCSFDKSMLILDVPYNYDFSKTLLFNVKGKYFKKMLHVMCNT
ncbi:uncharacterized protein LOC116160569 isoform X1 [Photinus pyralis]|uniref:uncharacterized protein LOC116160569 isoform X1 n=1 Tax=Photinus pyralis TaxID=7054 RepID=UPI0012670DFF|nr:uncharacterized protein LOC116160569 isoform X1 [Photinus pyralis]XP_031329651.1 uncharacterized protein LOC116160569 isoform X1 [Photinus pyralis]